MTGLALSPSHCIWILFVRRSRSSAFPGMGLFPFLLASLLLMKGALGQEWGVWYNNDDLTAQEDSNISIPCSYRYPNRQQVSKTMWYKYNNIIVYHSDAQQIHSFYKARTWYHEDKNRDCTLQITNLRMEDSGWYYFRFWTNNDYYYSGSFVKLTVTENPCWASINSPNIFEEEKMVTVICSVRKSSNVPYWSYNSTDISEQTYSPPYYINIILRLIPSRHDHGRVLFCRRPGCLDKELKLNIWYSPDGVQLYSSSNIQSPVDAGQNVTLRCEVSSSNPPVTRYSWYKNGTELVTSAQNLLLFESIKASDSGIYHCVVHNEIGNSSSQPISINVACSSCVAVFPAALGAVAVLLVLLTIGIGTLFYMRSRKRREAVRSASISTHIYDNVTILFRRIKFWHRRSRGHLQPGTETKQKIQDSDSSWLSETGGPGPRRSALLYNPTWCTASKGTADTSGGQWHCICKHDDLRELLFCGCIKIILLQNTASHSNIDMAECYHCPTTCCLI
ncbi:sialoadhesin isoform X4 [Microcaecilia unicolor]|uniref:Sialoadhesin-like isoform X4 n=1 Tax=Microcaecilia unicolor TaxID=1415580 RepID=A0A6P7YWA7_9AMPH|nr:sialoadhesin-like isoform X4 [Microcaecilia unicolor]